MNRIDEVKRALQLPGVAFPHEAQALTHERETEWGLAVELRRHGAEYMHSRGRGAQQV